MPTSPRTGCARDWWTGPRLFVLMDDYDMVASGMDYPGRVTGPLLAQGAEIGLHVIVARTTVQRHAWHE